MHILHMATTKMSACEAKGPSVKKAMIEVAMQKQVERKNNVESKAMKSKPVLTAQRLYWTNRLLCR